MHSCTAKVHQIDSLRRGFPFVLPKNGFKLCWNNTLWTLSLRCCPCTWNGVFAQFLLGKVPTPTCVNTTSLTQVWVRTRQKYSAFQVQLVAATEPRSNHAECIWLSKSLHIESVTTGCCNDDANAAAGGRVHEYRGARLIYADQTHGIIPYILNDSL